MEAFSLRETDGERAGHEAGEMKFHAAFTVACAIGCLALLASCNGQIERGDGCGGPNPKASAFCDVVDEVPPDPIWGDRWPPSEPPPSPPPQACVTDTFAESVKGVTCVDHRASPDQGGEVCRDSRDCESVCCVRDERGRWTAFSSADAGRVGAGVDAAPERDASPEPGDAEADGGVLVDASADAGGPGTVGPPVLQRAWQCSCGLCPSATRVCESLNDSERLGP